MAVAPVGVVAANPANFSFSAASPASSATGDDARPAKKSNSNLLLVGGLGGLCAAVAIVGIGIAVWKLSGSPDEVADETGDSQTELVVASGATDVNPVDIDPMDTNPVAEANPAPAAAPKSGGEARPAAPASGPAAGEKVLAAQTKWSNILKVTGITLNSVKLSITSAWLASDAAGTRVNPVVPGAAPAAAPAASAAPGSSGEGSALEPATADTASSEPAPAENATDAPLTSSTPEPAALPAKYVFVEVKITNGSPVPKKYASWNGRSADEVVLADQANRVLAFVPPAATPGVQRQGVVQLAPGQTITDVLVFAAPEQPVEMLKLALVKTALADAAKGQHWGFEIPLEALFPKPVEAAKPAAPVFAEGPRPPASTNGGQPGSISELNATIKGPDRSPDALPPVTAPSPAAPMPDPNAPKKPPSIEELNKQFEELSKPAGGAAANPPAPPKPTPEK
ncbi:MAG: hypothetical protein SFU86_05200 [Pirellulaceae bacterium]|nr:hypothetical protein [Pirellulaceae bacterium]